MSEFAQMGKNIGNPTLVCKKVIYNPENDYFSTFSFKTYILGVKKKHLAEVFLSII